MIRRLTVHEDGEVCALKIHRSDVCGNLGNRWCIAAFILGHDFNPTGQKVIANPGVSIGTIFQ